MNPQNDLVKSGETTVQSDPNQTMPQTNVPPSGAYQQSTTAKVLQETAEVAGIVGIATGLIGTLKGLFGKK